MTGVGLVLIMLHSGCGQHGIQPLTFEETQYNFGILETSGAVRHRFNFRVWPDSAVKITYIGSTCCGALPIEPNLTGKLLDPGSQHSVDILLGREYTGERAQVDVNIETEPRSSRPVVLSVTGLLVQSVRAHPNPLRIEQSSGNPSVGKLRFTRLRTSEIEQLALDVSKSDLQGLVMEQMTAATEKVGHPDLSSPRFVDTVDVELSAPIDFGDGRHELTCRFAWKNEGLSSTLLPVTVLVSHPYRPVLDRLFCGELRPGGLWEKELRMVKYPGASSSRVAIEAPHMSSARFSATFDPVGDSLRLRVHAGSLPGRFDATIKLIYSDPKLPDFPIRVSGIVQAK